MKKHNIVLKVALTSLIVTAVGLGNAFGENKGAAALAGSARTSFEKSKSPKNIKEIAKKASAKRVIDNATSENILKMVILLKGEGRGKNKGKQRYDFLIALCKVDCKNLTAAATGRILYLMHENQDVNGSGLYRIQRDALEKASLPWEKFSGPDLTKYILPELNVHNRLLATTKWLKAHSKQPKD